LERFFNTAGPMKPEINYCIDPLTRIDWEDIQRLINDMRYFVLHAPRQTGKTSTLQAMMDTLNEEGRYACAYANIETAQAARGDVAQGILTVLLRAPISTRLCVYYIPSSTGTFS